MIVRRKYSSFTLIELTVVLLILSLLVAIVLPAIGRLPFGVRMRNAKSDISHAFKNAGLRAMASGSPAVLTLNPENGTMKIKTDTSFKIPKAADREVEEPEFRGESPLLESPLKYKLPNGCSFEAEYDDLDDDGNAVFRFYPSGEAGGPPIDLVISEVRFSMYVDPLTGAVKFLEQEF